MDCAMIWVCPRCRGALANDQASLRCGGCSSRFEVIDGIPDLRVAGDSWIDFDDDLSLARRLAGSSLALPELVREVYAVRPNWDEERIATRTRQVLEAPDRLRQDVTGWLAPVLANNDPYLDLGCGAGMLIAAGYRAGHVGVGIDVSMTWLVVAKRLIEASGGQPVLAAALGEALPLADGAVGAVVSLDVIEHVRDPDTYLREIGRVTRPGGGLALSTPNRFSLTAEPHVFVWGVGWLPQKWQRSYVRWRSGKDYDDTILMSSLTLAERVRRNSGFDVRIDIPHVPAEHIANFAPVKASIAGFYNRLASARLLRPLFLAIGPFFRVTGTKPTPGKIEIK